MSFSRKQWSFFCGVDIKIRIGSQNNARGRNFNPFQRLHSERKDLKENSAFWSNYFRMHFVFLECVIGYIWLCHWFNLIQYRIQNILTPVSMKWLNLSMSYPSLSESNTLGARWTSQCGAWRAAILPMFSILDNDIVRLKYFCLLMVELNVSFLILIDYFEKIQLFKRKTRFKFVWL